MNQLLLIFIALLFVGCQRDTQLFDEVLAMAEFDSNYHNITLIQSGKDRGFLKPMMEYLFYNVDSLAFQNLEKAIMTSEKFKEGNYYLNIELDDYLYQNKLDILNMSNSSITENKFDKTYYVYLLSDRKTFAVCKVNH
ncbi:MULTISPECIES: hypothetical protein [Aequorivita]|uniref:Lipoprotein n=1 Tax=Aequorivita iocasae TaxID=2803865 RepID=A0ABX7DS27_9FLAO|nr:MULTISPECIES: hypothetical protein [Aequorivita]QQX76391.1 hypothetical protein JK629_13840 [Aequorivita iocasae]UCA55860.1 hypothetical protein LDL78_13910 [Aequorivita sp. F7]